MTTGVRLLERLPTQGTHAVAFPSEWGQEAHEGTVVEFETEAGVWVGNFQPGLGGLEGTLTHPSWSDAVVLAAGDLWVVHPETRTAVRQLFAVEAALEVQDPDGWVLSRQGLALARLGPNGLLWHTRRLSSHGFDRLVISGDELTGLARSPADNGWRMFRVDLRTGRSTGGACGEEDAEGWEKLAPEPTGA